MKPDYKHLVEIAIEAALRAGEAIIDVYNTDFEVIIKKDKSPLTLADKHSHHIITDFLTGTHIPILSEEGIHTEYSKRKQWDYLWLIDPLDGTKEFVNKRDEFCICIALIHCNKAIMGIVYLPALKIMYFNIPEVGAYRFDNYEKLKKPKQRISINEVIGLSQKLPLLQNRTNYLVIGSRSHIDEKTLKFVEELKQEHPNLEFVNKGSCYKFGFLAEGSADIYPRLAPTMEWDTAAGQAIFEAVGGKVLVYETNEPLRYNREELRNPEFIAYGI